MLLREAADATLLERRHAARGAQRGLPGACRGDDCEEQKRLRCIARAMGHRKTHREVLVAASDLQGLPICRDDGSWSPS
jgi:hypothetical protein